MTKKKTTQFVNVPAVATQVVALAPEEAAPAISPEVLTALNVDTRLTKAELVEYIEESLTNQIKEELKRINKEMDELVKQRKAKKEAEVAELVSKYIPVEEFAKIKKDFSKMFPDIVYKVGVVRSYENNRYCAALNGYRELGPNNTANIVRVLVPLSEEDSRSYEAAYNTIQNAPCAYSTEHKKLQERREALANYDYDMKRNTKKVRIELTRTILGSSEDGKKLLAVLDSKVRGLKLGNMLPNT